MKKTVLTFCMVLLAHCLFAQEQQTTTPPSQELQAAPQTVPDTVEIISLASKYDPKKAALYAAVLPGLGQIYNKKYWKLPLVYGGFIGFGYGVSFYQKGYTKYKSELFDILESDAPLSTSGYTEDQLRTIVDKYRRERDFFMILLAGMYFLQIVDAHVDAHLKEFDLNPKLHVRIEPTMENDMLAGRTAGFSIKFRF
jgi:hypothetical protein